MIIYLIILLFAIVFHEYAHGWVAYKLGDPTAKQAGRLTLNPIKHVDPVGTVILPVVLSVLHLPLFGWAKPVPVNFMRLGSPRRDMIWVAMAGPFINIILALMFSVILKLNILQNFESYFSMAVFLNVLLAVFNMLPIPPLDGSRLVMGLLPKNLAIPYSRLERYGLLIVAGLIFLNVFEIIILPVVLFICSLLGVN